MSMSKKDYNLIADGLGRLLAKNAGDANLLDPGELDRARLLVESATAIFTNLLADDNPRFRTDSFRSTVSESFLGYSHQLRGMTR